MASVGPVSFPADFAIAEVLADDAAGLDAIRFLFRSHQMMLLGLGVDIAAFQGFDDELAGLPGKYSPAKHGRLFLLRYTDEDGGFTPAGCIAYYEFDTGVTELKRLFVNPAFRGQNLGELLSRHAIAAAAADGFRRIILDTLERLPFATAVYKRLGFTPCERYNDNPLPDILYFELFVA